MTVTDLPTTAPIAAPMPAPHEIPPIPVGEAVMAGAKTIFKLWPRAATICVSMAVAWFFVTMAGMMPWFFLHGATQSTLAADAVIISAELLVLMIAAVTLFGQMAVPALAIVRAANIGNSGDVARVLSRPSAQKSAGLTHNLRPSIITFVLAVGLSMAVSAATGTQAFFMWNVLGTAPLAGIVFFAMRGFGPYLDADLPNWSVADRKAAMRVVSRARWWPMALLALVFAVLLTVVGVGGGWLFSWAGQAGGDFELPILALALAVEAVVLAWALGSWTWAYDRVSIAFGGHAFARAVAPESSAFVGEMATPPGRTPAAVGADSAIENSQP